ncbi:MAG TPA: Arc family DNA-binding protein [Thermoanaerobaculia bacterium]|nr:Arc family DNA-binding protein [Thermoanaerobaculia bacterium]
MATLTLKNVPDELVERLKREAKENRRSLNQETLLRLEKSLATRRRSVEETLAALRRLHVKMEGLPPVDDEFIARAKAEGRP